MDLSDLSSLLLSPCARNARIERYYQTYDLVYSPAAVPEPGLMHGA